MLTEPSNILVGYFLVQEAHGMRCARVSWAEVVLKYNMLKVVQNTFRVVYFASWAVV